MRKEKTEHDPIPAINLVYFYLTEGCNLSCRHCWMGPRFDATGNQTPFLAVDLFETAIREAKPLGMSGIKLTGGEPLLHPHFTDLLEIAQREGLRLIIETNGLLCTPRIAAEIAKFTDRFVSVSIDGADAKTHEWVRGVSGSFKAAWQAVKNLTDAGIRTQIIFTAMRCNISQVDDIVRMAEKAGVDSVKFNIVQPIARGEKLYKERETLDIADLIDLERHVEKELIPNAKVKIFFHAPPAFKSLHLIAGDGCCGTCGIFGILGVIASGHYALCGIGEQVTDLVFGEVGKDSLKSIWQNNAILKTLRNGLPEMLEGVCSRCLMKYRCLGSCIAQNYYSKGSLWAPYWFCEQAEKLGLFPVSRLEKGPEYDKD